MADQENILWELGLNADKFIADVQRLTIETRNAKVAFDEAKKAGADNAEVLGSSYRNLNKDLRTATAALDAYTKATSDSSGEVEKMAAQIKVLTIYGEIAHEESPSHLAGRNFSIMDRLTVSPNYNSLLADKTSSSLGFNAHFLSHQGGRVQLSWFNHGAVNIVSATVNIVSLTVNAPHAMVNIVSATVNAPHATVNIVSAVVNAPHAMVNVVSAKVNINGGVVKTVFKGILPPVTMNYMISKININN